MFTFAKKPTTYSHRRRVIRSRRRVANTPLNQRLSRRTRAFKCGCHGNASVLSLSQSQRRTTRGIAVLHSAPALSCGLIIPKIGKMNPPVLAEGSSAYHTAYIADEFYKAGILRDSDWNGDLSTSLQAAINRWVMFDCRGQFIADGLGLFEFIYTDNVDSQEYLILREKSDSVGYICGAFILTNRFSPQRYDLGFNCTKLNSLKKNLGFEIFNVVAYFVSHMLEGMTPWIGLEVVKEWAYGEGIGTAESDDGGEEGKQRSEEIWGFSQQSIRSENPSEILVDCFELPKVEVVHDFVKAPPVPHFGNDEWNFGHAISLKVLELLETHRRLQELPNETNKPSVEIGAPLSPPVFVNWHAGEENSLARWSHDYYEYEMDGERCMAHYIRTFVIPPRGIENSSLALNIKKMELSLKILSLLQELLNELDSDEAIPEPRKEFKGRPLAEVLGLEASYNEEDFIDQL